MRAPLFSVEKWATVMVLVAAGCSGSDPGPHLQLKTPAISVGAGQEQYLCFAVQLSEPADVAITAFESLAPVEVHHLEVFQALAPEPLGLHPCDASVKTTWLPLFGGGQNAGGLVLPPSAGFKLPGDAELLLQLHLLNATHAPVEDQVTINMKLAPDPTAVTPAGIFAFGSMQINLPPSSTGMKVTAGCALPKALDVFAVQPHMHTRGRRITFETGPSTNAAQVVYRRDPWQFGAQPIDDFHLPLVEGSFGRVTCTFDNPTDHAITYGESTADEMCYLVLFYTPFDRLGACLQ